MTTDNHDKKVAIVVADGFEQIELEVPRQALQKAGFATEIVSPGAQSTVQGYHRSEKGDAFPIDVPLEQASPEFYSALLLPGGVHNPDELRHNPKVLDFVRHFFAVDKPVAAICHGPWTLIDAQVVSGRRLTSWASIKTDLINAGAEWVNEPVVVDRGLVTSRGPQDLATFCKKMVEQFQHEPGLWLSTHEAAMLSKLNELIKHIKVAMLTMRMPDGSLHSCPMMTQGKRFDRNLWFFVAASSCKGQEAEKDCPVNVSYADPSASRFVSVSGRAKLVRERSKLQELWTPLAKAWFPKGLDDPELSLMQVSVERAEYWDTPASNTVTLLQLAKLLLTGRTYQGEGATHERIQIEPPRSQAAPKDLHKDAARHAARRTARDETARVMDTSSGADTGMSSGAVSQKSAGPPTAKDRATGEDAAAQSQQAASPAHPAPKARAPQEEAEAKSPASRAPAASKSPEPPPRRREPRASAHEGSRRSHIRP